MWSVGPLLESGSFQWFKQIGNFPPDEETEPLYKALCVPPPKKKIQADA